MKLQITNQLIIIIIITNLLFSHFCSAAAVGDTLTPSTPLYSGDALISPNGSFTLVFFTPNNSSNLYIGIRYHKIATHDVVWVANRRHPISASNGASVALTLNPNGTLFIVNRDSSIIFWSSPSTQNRSVAVANPVAQLLDTGNLVIRDAGGGADNDYIWQSFDYPTDTFLAGMKLGWDLRSGLNRNITSWSSASDPSPGPYVGGISLRGVPQLVITDGEKWYTRGGPWVGIGWTGTPQMPKSNNGAIIATFVANSEEVYYSFEPLGSVVSRMTMKAEGVAKRSVWFDPPGEWKPFWLAPKDECDLYSVCGPYGICNSSTTPVPCSCLPGFWPRNQASWALRSWSDGCVRKTALDCPQLDGSGRSSDKFVPVPRAKLPDTAAAVEDKSLGLRECRDRCLMNCSCTAYSSADFTGKGSGCIMWTGELNDLRTYDDAGQELYLRLAASEIEGSNSTSSQSNQDRKIAAIVVPIVVSFFICTLLIGWLVIRRRQMKKRKRSLGSFEGENEGSGDDKDIELPLFDFRTIVEATNNFCQQNKLGEGGFGPVYMGMTADGQEIAVKRLSESSSQGLDEFKNEVMLIAKLQHRNLVRLLGCCVQRQERLLIYEYMPNKSLDTFLFDEEKKVSLCWQLRYRIIVGIARGLLYLHQDSAVTIVHRDLKASNILLNKEMVPKISDFGLARICGGDEAKSTKRVVGTYGYMSPEYAIEGLFCVKSDVFSFGVLILEIISGQRNRVYFTYQSYYQLLGQAWSLWKEGNILQLVDAAIDTTYSITEVLRCIKVGLLCVQERPEDRPLMSSVILMLTSDNEVFQEPTHPGFVATRQSVLAGSSWSKPESHSENIITITSTLIGR